MQTKHNSNGSVRGRRSFKQFIADILDGGKSKAAKPATREISAGPELRKALKNRKPFANMAHFLWLTHDGKVYDPMSMATLHIFYALRMIYNNSVPPPFRVAVSEFRRYPDIQRWDPEYRGQAIQVFAELLSVRRDLDPEFHYQWRDMQLNADLLNLLGVGPVTGAGISLQPGSPLTETIDPVLDSPLPPISALTHIPEDDVRPVRKRSTSTKSKRKPATRKRKAGKKKSIKVRTHFRNGNRVHSHKRSKAVS